MEIRTFFCDICGKPVSPVEMVQGQSLRDQKLLNIFQICCDCYFNAFYYKVLPTSLLFKILRDTFKIEVVINRVEVIPGNISVNFSMAFSEVTEIAEVIKLYEDFALTTPMFNGCILAYSEERNDYTFSRSTTLGTIQDIS